MICAGLKNAKQKGSRNEHKSMLDYEKAGFYCMRSAGSLGMWDFIAINCVTGDVHFVQVKSNRPPRPAEMETLRAFKAGKFVKFLHIWVDYVRKPKVEVIP